MPGSLIVKPIEANITQNTDPLGKMSPYCNFKVGRTNFKTQVCYKGGKHPHWNDALTLPDTQPIITVDLLDKDMVTHDEHIGSFSFDLREVRAAGQVSKWYPLYHKNKAVGEILLQAAYQPGFGLTQSQYVKNLSYYQEQSYTGNSSRLTNSQSLYSTPIKPETNVSFNSVEKQYYTPQGKPSAAPSTTQQGNIWTEQIQVVTPRVFTKEVDVVETQTVLKEVEVMEPVKSLKNVQYTKAVPVKKQVEVSRPEVVMKEIEVMEPRVITKTIQVVENVPVKRQIQVVEMKNIVQEVETREPQTFTKKVEVTEYKPVKKQLEVTQPITLKKAVEFVEPVITTQTITKQQVIEPVIINTQVTETIGPASVVHVSTEFSAYERERLSKLQRWIGYDNIFNGLNYEEKLWEQRRLSKLSEQEWIQERERLLKLDAEERLTEQRELIQGEQDLDRSFVFTRSYKPSPNF